MRQWRDIPRDEQERILTEARSMKTSGEKMSVIARQFQIWAPTLSSLIDDNRRKVRAENSRRYHRARQRYRSRNIYQPIVGHEKGRSGPTMIDIAARLAEIPPDDRTDAEKLLGDPGYRRSALAQRSAP